MTTDSTVDDVASALLDALGPMTAMKLEKLVYYCQATYLGRFGEPLFTDEIQAWRDGPVIRHLYNQHAGLFSVSSWPSGDASHLRPAVRAVVANVVSRYGRLSAEELSDITHREEPWRATRAGLPAGANSERPIPVPLMASFYYCHGGSRAHAVEDVLASTELEGATVSSRARQSMEAVVSGQMSADDAVASLLASRAR